MPLFSAVEPLPVNRIKNRLFDPDARDYILRVEAADGDRLESSVRSAINDFVLGCKADGTWSAIRASCIMAGARTLNGAIVPLVGNAPTNGNFVSGDYNRKTGLLGDGSTKYINTGYVSNTFFQQNSNHMSIYVTSAPASSVLNKVFIGNQSALGSRLFLSKNAADQLAWRSASASTATNVSGQGITTGFKGGARSSSTAVVARSAQANTVGSISSATIQLNLNIYVFAGGASNQNLCDARMSFYSMGDNLDLALLDTRITTFMNALSAILP
jgi:hypothetical protein